MTDLSNRRKDRTTLNPLVRGSSPRPPTKKSEGWRIRRPLFFCDLGRICAGNVGHKFRVPLKVCRSQMGVSPDHCVRFPRAHPLNHVKRRSVLHVPAGPCVSQVVPAKIPDACTNESFAPCFGIGPSCYERRGSSAVFASRWNAQLLLPTARRREGFGRVIGC